MKPKIHYYGDTRGMRLYGFHCPGCKYVHGFPVGGEEGWAWNGSLEAPTFTPSLLCNKSDPSRRCHLVVTDGRIQFLTDCYHTLAGQLVDIPDWE